MYSTVKPISKYFRVKSVRIYDFVFMLHSRCTAAFLLAFSIMHSAKNLFGEPIKCYTDFPNNDFINSYCWTMGTYIVRNMTGSHAAGFGIGLGSKSGDDRVYLRYYQWVVSVLVIQGIIFYMPTFLWEVWENNRIKNLCNSVNVPLIPDTVYNEHLAMLLQYFRRDMGTIHTMYMIKYIFCEILNFLISLYNFYILNIFLNNEWWNYIEVFKYVYLYDWDIWNEFTSQLFPKEAKCDFSSFGVSGTKANRDALCLLPLNILNEKIFTFLWAWFLLVGVVATIKLIFRFLMLCCFKFRVELLRNHLRCMPRYQIADILVNRSIGDWFLFIRLSENMNETMFAELMRNLSEYTVKKTMI